MDMERVEYRKSADGRLVPRQNRSQFFLILTTLLTAILLIIGVLAYQSTHRSESGSKLQIMAAQVFVRAELQPAADDQIKFSPPEETDVHTIGGNMYQVAGWVDRISAEGEAQRLDYSCQVRQNPSGDWVKENLLFFPQS